MQKIKYFIMEGFNVDFNQGNESSNKNILSEILDIFTLHHLITERTRITEMSRTTIYLCLTNS